MNSFKPNGHGLLYDMTGNVWKWYGDWYDENYDSDPSAKKLLRAPVHPGCFTELGLVILLLTRSLW